MWWTCYTIGPLGNACRWNGRELPSSSNIGVGKERTRKNCPKCDAGENLERNEGCEMKNIFNYATKELSQDAFISWALDNYDDEETPGLKEAAYAFLWFLIGGEKGIPFEGITRARVERQEANIDVIFKFWIGEEEHWLAIEDKTYSSEHNQLGYYNAYLMRFPNVHLYRRYYKTSPMKEDELNTIEKSGWKNIDFEEICDFWNRYKESEIFLLKQYCEHLEQIQEYYRQKLLPNLEKGSPVLRDLIDDYLSGHKDQFVFLSQPRQDWFYLYPKTLVDKGLIHRDPSGTDVIGLGVYLAPWKGEILVYCWFEKGAKKRPIDIPNGFRVSSWYKDWLNLECPLGSFSALETEEGRKKILDALEKTIDNVCSAKTV